MEDVIVNRVDKSPLITINLDDYITPGERIALDIKNLLYEGLILKEKDFREFLEEHDWTEYTDKNVALFCSADAVIPTWAYMLLASKLHFYARNINFGSLDDLEISLFKDALSAFNPEQFKDKKVVIKGCSRQRVPESAYVELTKLLSPFVSSIMYGEPCSTVPIYKKKNSKNQKPISTKGAQ